MANMSYCQFQNTLRDFNQCARALRDLANHAEPLSADELEAAKDLLCAANEALKFVCQNAPAQQTLQARHIAEAVDALQADARSMEDDQ